MKGKFQIIRFMKIKINKFLIWVEFLRSQGNLNSVILIYFLINNCFVPRGQRVLSNWFSLKVTFNTGFAIQIKPLVDIWGIYSISHHHPFPPHSDDSIRTHPPMCTHPPSFSTASNPPHFPPHHTIPAISHHPSLFPTTLSSNRESLILRVQYYSKLFCKTGRPEMGKIM